MTLSHPLDTVRNCPCCRARSLCRYNGAQIVGDVGRLVEVRLFTCGACGTTFTADYEARPDATEADLMRVTDRREWGLYRAARMRGLSTEARETT